MDKLGERIFALRTAKNMSQGDLAAALDVSRQAVSKWENGMGTPTPENIVAMSALFGVTTDYILVGKENAAEEKAGEAPRAEEGFGKRKLAQIIGVALVSLGAVLSVFGVVFTEVLVFTVYMIAVGLFCLWVREDLRYKIFNFTLIYIMLVAVLVAFCEATFDIW